MFPVPWSSRWSWSLLLFLCRPMSLRPFGLYCSACFGSLFVSILCACCSHFSGTVVFRLLCFVLPFFVCCHGQITLNSQFLLLWQKFLYVFRILCFKVCASFPRLVVSPSAVANNGIYCGGEFTSPACLRIRIAKFRWLQRIAFLYAWRQKQTPGCYWGLFISVEETRVPEKICPYPRQLNELLDGCIAARAQSINSLVMAWVARFWISTGKFMFSQTVTG